VVYLNANAIQKHFLFLGFDPTTNWNDPLHFYGTESKKVESLDLKGNKSLSDKLYITKNQICWAIKSEMAMTLEDVLARRTRCLFLDAYETEKIAPKVAEIMAIELKKEKKWIIQELKNFNLILKNYQL